jgi:O-antigen ligase
VLLTGLAATVSRAAVAALLVGLVVLGWLAGVRPTFRQAVPPVVGALVAFGALMPSLPAGAPAHPGMASGGLIVGVSLAVGVDRLRRGRTGVAAGTLALLAFAAGYTTAASVSRVAAARLTFDSSGRAGAMHAALRMVQDRPLLGVGPGRARFLWIDGDGRGFVARYAHDEYMQVFVELGGVGLAIVLALLATLVVTVARGRSVPVAGRALWAGAGAAFAVLLVHSAFDFLWQIPVLPLTGAIVVGLAAPGTTTHVLTPPPMQKGEPCENSH